VFEYDEHILPISNLSIKEINHRLIEINKESIQITKDFLMTHHPSWMTDGKDVDYPDDRSDCSGDTWSDEVNGQIKDVVKKHLTLKDVSRDIGDGMRVYSYYDSDKEKYVSYDEASPFVIKDELHISIVSDSEQLYNINEYVIKVDDIQVFF
jgi:hypothetical protein